MPGPFQSRTCGVDRWCQPPQCIAAFRVLLLVLWHLLPCNLLACMVQLWQLCRLYRGSSVCNNCDIVCVCVLMNLSMSFPPLLLAHVCYEAARVLNRLYELGRCSSDLGLYLTHCDRGLEDLVWSSHKMVCAFMRGTCAGMLLCRSSRQLLRLSSTEL